MATSCRFDECCVQGFCRKIYDGAETQAQRLSTECVVRKDFGEKYPEIVVGYIER